MSINELLQECSFISSQPVLTANSIVLPYNALMSKRKDLINVGDFVNVKQEDVCLLYCLILVHSCFAAIVG